VVDLRDGGHNRSFTNAGSVRTLVSDGVEMVKYDLLVLLVDLLLLAQDDIAFAFDGATFELGVLEDVGDDVDRLGDVLAEALGVVDRLLARGVRIEVSAEILHFELERMLGAPAGALECHVFEEVGRTVGRVRLGARAGVYPHADGRGLGMRMRLCRDGEAV
jgi:hypothetical protein